MTKKIGVISLGCDKNRVDTEYMLGIILGSNYKLTADTKDAQIIVINTCAFLQAARKEAIDTILECNLLRENALEKIVVTGCLSQKYIDEIFDDLIEVDVFLGTNDYELLPEMLDKAYKGERVNAVGKAKPKLSTVKIKNLKVNRVLSTPKSYAYLKIAEGCDNKCTYCLIPKIRGKYTSQPMDKLILETKSLGQIQELILVAQDITKYGNEFGASLPQLIERLSQLENVKTIRLLYCYPDLIDDKLIETIKNNAKVIKYLDMPLQHTEDRILKLMNRPGSREQYLQLIEKLRESVPEIAIRTTFITGFPSETHSEHMKMLEFLQEAKFFNAGFFAYSREEDTPAYRLKGQISQKVKENRLENCYKKQTEIASEILNSYIGKTLDVLCDEIKDGKAIGRAYFSAPDIDTNIVFECKNAQVAKRYKVEIIAQSALELIGVNKESL